MASDLFVLISMNVHKYIPDKLYGFCVDREGNQAFFHLGVFHPGSDVNISQVCKDCPTGGECTWLQSPPPPVLGEKVEVEIDLTSTREGKAPRASKVVRLNSPKVCTGKVCTFDAVRGFGFVDDRSGVSYHLHRSEILDGKIPLTGQRVVFYAGVRQGRPRACHVKVCNQ